MDEVMKRAIETVQSKTRASVPWELDQVWKQTPYIYSSDEERWIPQKMEKADRASSKLNTVVLYQWNIDFMLPHADSRMQIGLEHIRSLVEQQPEDTATIIYLQECVESDIEVLAASPWIRSSFVLSDINIDNWQSGHYGTITLIDRRLPIRSCFRVHYSQTRMERDGLFVDVHLGNEDNVVRFCNTHLESLALEPPYRPPQMQEVAKYMHDPAVHAAVVAGDFNAIQDFDLRLHSDNDLKDAYLELGGSENDAATGHTWGQQAATAQRERFGTSRMDKVFYCGGIRCISFERFGAGVELEDENERQDVVSLGFDRPWITDHLGVKAVLELTSRS